MNFITRFQRHRMNSKLESGIVYPGNDNMADDVLKAARDPNLADLVKPAHVEMAMTYIIDDDAGAKFVALAAALRSKPALLAETSRAQIVDGLYYAISQAEEVGNPLAIAVEAIEKQNIHNRSAVLAGLRDGTAELVQTYDLDNDEIGTALAQLADTTLMKHPEHAQAILTGVQQGATALIAGGNAETMFEIMEAMGQPKAHTVYTVHDMKLAFANGIEDGLEQLAFTSPHQARDLIGRLSEMPELIPDVTERHVQVVARGILRSHADDCLQNRAEIADFAQDMQQVPHLAFAVAKMPESQRLVMFPSTETGSDYPMVIEATPHDGLRVTTGCRVYQTPRERIDAWMGHEEGSRRETTIPLVFEGIAKLTQSAYSRPASAAARELQALAEIYKNDWSHRLPAAATTRIDAVVPAQYRRKAASPQQA
mgnify:CR=1 FL=1